MSGPQRAGAHPIEIESDAIPRARLDVSDLLPPSPAVAHGGDPRGHGHG